LQISPREHCPQICRISQPEVIVATAPPCDQREMYARYKPLRNFLRGFNLWSGLGTVYSYMQYLQFGRELPESLSTFATKWRMNNFKAQLYPHVVELLARELILNGQRRGGKEFATAELSHKAMRMILDIDGEAWGSHPARSDDILLHLSRIGFQQFPWQRSLTTGLLARYHALYAHPAVAPIVEVRFEMSVNELFQLIMLLIEETRRQPVLALEFLTAAEASIVEPTKTLISHLSSPIDELQAQIAALQCYDVNWAHSFNPLRAYPLVHAGNPASVMCPAPPLLIQRLTDGLYFDLIRSDRAFGDAIGTAFEAYVGKVAAAIGGGAFTLLPEGRWGKPERRSVDWIMADDSAILFVECKLARLDIASQTEISEEPAFLVALEKLAGSIGQLYATLGDGLAGKYPHWQPDGRPIHPLVVTFYDWLVFGPYFYKHLDQRVGLEFERRGLDRSLLDRHPYSVCSISELEGLLTAARAHSIDVVLTSKNRPEARQSLMHGFLVEHYPECISKLRGTFDDGMDAVTEGSSRFTGRR